MVAPGQKLGAYQLLDRLGAGGMGEVWKAEDPRLGRTVAIKILPPAVAADHESILRMQREARTAAQLYHPNIATIHSIEEDAGQLFIVMEYVQGDPLTKLIESRKLSEADVCRIGRGVAEALAEAHEKGIVHRDIKPDNIIVNGQRVKVLDFGIAKRVGVEMGTTSSDAPTAFVTQQGMIVGTVHYMSPEQALGKPLDARSDIFSLGVVMYEAVTGQRPFGGETITDTITRIVRDEPAAPSRLNPAISPGFNAIIQRCLRKNRDERFGSAAELSSALDQQLGRASTELMTAPTVVKPVVALPTVIEEKPRKSRAWIWAVVIALVVLGALAALRARRRVTASAAAPVAVTATHAAPPQPAQSTVSVTAPPAVIEEEKPKPKPAPEPARVQETQQRTEPPPPIAPPPAAAPPPDARAHFQNGEAALLNHDFEQAKHELRMALDEEAELNDRERRLAQLSIAIANGNRLRARELGREFEGIYPGDPDFARIKEAFVPEGAAPNKHPLFPRRRRF